MKTCLICGKAADDERGGEFSVRATWHDEYRYAFCAEHYNSASFAFGVFVAALTNRPFADVVKALVGKVPPS